MIKTVKKEELQLYLNEMLKTYMNLISNEYKDYIPENRKESIKTFIGSNNVVNRIVAEYDGQELDVIESQLIHEIFCYFISPEHLAGYEQISSIISETISDIVALEFMQKNSIFPSYHSNYSKYIIFMKERLESIGSNEEKLLLMFRGSIKQIIDLTSKSQEEFFTEFSKAESNETDFDKLLNSISALSQNNQDKMKRVLLKLATRSNSKLDAIEQMKTVIPSIMPEIGMQTRKLIDEYLNPEISKSY